MTFLIIGWFLLNFAVLGIFQLIDASLMNEGITFLLVLNSIIFGMISVFIGIDKLD